MKTYLRKGTGKISWGTMISDDDPRADMFLPSWLFVLGMLITVFGVVESIIVLVLNFNVFLLFAGICCFTLGVAALLCWKNQRIRMLPNDSFEYSTFWGNKKIYRFEEITGLKKNRDSMTLLVGNEKVHIESCAILSERLIKRIDRKLKKIYEDPESL